MDKNSKIRLNNGISIPIIGLGVWAISTKNTEKAVLTAFKAGYRQVDTAAMYGNEKEVGEAVRKSRIPRKDLFITTKLWGRDQSNPLQAFNESLRKLQTGYIDLYLIHWPFPNRDECWKVLEKIYESGKCKAIGVSNYNISQLKELMSFAKVLPAVNQIECTPYLYPKELHEFCNSRHIAIQAYSPLTQGEKLSDYRLISLSEKYSRSPAQILLRWNIQHGNIIIPKSEQELHIRENIDIFDFNISKEDMGFLDSFS